MRKTRFRLRFALAVIAAVVTAAAIAPLARASSPDGRVRPVGPSSVLHAESTGVKGFAFYSGAPASLISAHLPPGFTLGSCLEHRAPMSDPPATTADLLVEVLEHSVPELGGATIRLAGIATCAHPPAGRGYPEPVPAESPVFSALGRPSAPMLVSLGTWHDSNDEGDLAAINDFVERFGMHPGRARIAIDRAAPAGGWTATVTIEDGSELFRASFPSRTLGGQYVGCADYFQEGHLVEWERGRDDFGIVHFTHFVEGKEGSPSDDRRPGKLCLFGGGFSWGPSSHLGQLAGGGTRPATISGQQLEEPGVHDHWEFQRYRATRAPAADVARR